MDDDNGDLPMALLCLMLVGLGIAAYIIIGKLNDKINMLDKRIANIELSGSRRVDTTCKLNYHDLTLSLYFDSDIGHLKVLCPKEE